MEPTETPFAGLIPEVILDAVETTGRRASGQLLALNSYENRVYQVGLDDEAPLVVKFYRPGRWSDAAILEEHTFTAELATHELPVVPPLAGSGGTTLFAHAGWRFALFPRRGGRLVDLDDPERRRLLGRLLGRLHACGERCDLLRPRADRRSDRHGVLGVRERGRVRAHRSGSRRR